jgi:A/G-specific adenine glycosylase
MLIIQAQEQILLQRRPTEGIWGGLWSLPESSWQKIALDSFVQSPKIKKSFSTKKLLQMIFASGQVAEKTVDQFIKLSDKPAAGLLLKHVFTHRVLWIQSWRIQLNQPIPIAGTDYAWFKLNELDALGLPQAIRVIFRDWNLIPDADKVNE